MAFGVHANATTTYPELLAREPSRYLLDGVMIDSGVLPGESWLGKVAVHEVGHWLGLRHPDESKDCVEDSDMIADTPVAKRTRGCPDKPVRTCGGPDNDPVHNHMSYTNEYVFPQRQPNPMTMGFANLNPGLVLAGKSSPKAKFGACIRYGRSSAPTAEL